LALKQPAIAVAALLAAAIAPLGPVLVGNVPMPILGDTLDRLAGLAFVLLVCLTWALTYLFYYAVTAWIVHVLRIGG
jgi:hypothetical protein